MVKSFVDYKTLIQGYETLKRQVEAAIKDEKEAQRMYGDLGNVATNIGMGYVASQIRRIRDQEIQHEQTFRTILTSIDTAAGVVKKEEEKKRKKQEQEELEKQKKTRSQTFR